MTTNMTTIMVVTITIYANTTVTMTMIGTTKMIMVVSKTMIMTMVATMTKYMTINMAKNFQTSSKGQFLLLSQNNKSLRKFTSSLKSRCFFITQPTKFIYSTCTASQKISC